MIETAISTEMGPLAEQVARMVGLRFSEARSRQIASSIRRVMNARNVNAVDFLRDLSWDQNLVDELVAALTVRETSFFRGTEQFAFLRDEIIPELRSRRGGTSPIRICSIGCSTGEEPYSIAMLCDEAGISHEVRITAVDVSRQALDVAKQGEYHAWSLRNVPSAMVRRYFTASGPRFRVHELIIRQVEFGLLNIAAKELSWPSGFLADFDLVFCRNVLLYHAPGTLKRTADHLLKSLSRGGWLLTAPSDPLLSGLASFDVAATDAGVVYRRSPETIAKRQRGGIAEDRWKELHSNDWHVRRLGNPPDTIGARH